MAATQVPPGLISDPVGGVLGLAFAGVGATNSTPFLETLVTDGQLDSPEMSFWLTRHDPFSPPDDDVPGGVFTLGGTNSSLYTGTIEFTYLTETGGYPTGHFGDPDPAAETEPRFWSLRLTGEFPFLPP